MNTPVRASIAGQSSIALSKGSGGKPYTQGLRFGSHPARTPYGHIGVLPVLYAFCF